MTSLYSLILCFHVIAGATGLIVFWLPVFLRKGGRDHRRYGKMFAYAMYVAGIAGMVMASSWLMAPQMFRPELATVAPEDLPARILKVRLMGYFLAMLGILLIANVRHGVLVLRGRDDRSALRRPTHLLLVFLLIASGVLALVVGLRYEMLLLKIFSGVSLVNGMGMLFYCFKKSLTRMEWWTEHASNLIAAGIGAHTAFLVFGTRRFLGDLIPANYQILPWILPALVGVPATLLVTRHYRRKFNPAPTLQSAKSGV